MFKIKVVPTGKGFAVSASSDPSISVDGSTEEEAIGLYIRLFRARLGMTIERVVPISALLKERLQGRQITEHSPEGECVGTIEYVDSSAAGSICIGWFMTGGGNRTTVFSPQTWEGAFHEGVAYLRRTRSDSGHCDLPPPDVDQYSIQL